MFVTADQLVVHAVGDYILQSDWQATSKTSRWGAALVHVFLYGIPWLFLTQSPKALAFIVLTHLVIDRWRIARQLGWVKNFLAPRSGWPKPWAECSGTGYDKDKAPFMAVWLMIITDQILHVLCNAFALRYLA
jgi:hypothetical protein